MDDNRHRLDATGLHCPLPVLRAKRALKAISVGERLQVIATDPGSLEDFKAFAMQTGHALEEVRTEGDRFYFVLCKREP